MKRWFLILAVLALALPPVALGQGNLARLRFVQAAPNAPPLDLIVNDSTLFGNLDFRAVTPYALVTQGAANLRVAPTTQGQPPLIDVTADLSACTDYSLVAVGTPGQVEPLLLLDDNSPPAPGQARLRFVNASPDAPPVDVALQDGLLLFSDVPYKGVVGYASLKSGTHTFEVRQAGSSNVLLTIPDVALDSCSVYTIYLNGLVNAQPPLQAFTVLDAVTACVPPPTAVLPLVSTPTSTSTPIPAIVPRPVASVTPSATAVPEVTPVVVTPSATAVPEVTPVVITPSAAPTATATQPPTATPRVVVVTATPVSSVTPSPTVAVVTATPVSSVTPSPTVAVVTATPVSSVTPSPTVAVTATPQVTASATATPKATGTLTPTVTATGTLTPTVTATGTLTPTLTATPVTPTPTTTATPVTPTPTMTAKPTHKAQATESGATGITAVAPQTPATGELMVPGMDPRQEDTLTWPWWRFGPQTHW